MGALRIIRQLQFISQEAAAARAGLSQKMWSRIERGVREPDCYQQKAIARALGVDERKIFRPHRESSR